jgi:glycosyltransferase involved in cell wall biosynthesis
MEVCLRGSIGVVIPVFNKRRWVLRCIASVLAQTRVADDIVVVDDGSSDGSAELVKHVFPRVRVLRQDNSGEGAARNRGVEELNTTWIAFLDADDVWLPTHLATLEGIVSGQEHCMWAASSIVEWHQGSPPPMPEPSDEIFTCDYFTSRREARSFSPSSVMVRRDCLRQTNGFSSEPVGCDTATWARIGLRYPIVRSLSQTVIYVRNVGGVVESSAASGGAHRPPEGSNDLTYWFGPDYRLLKEYQTVHPEEISRTSGLMNERVIAATKGAALRGDRALAKSLLTYHSDRLSMQALSLRWFLGLSPGFANFVMRTRHRLRDR